MPASNRVAESGGEIRRMIAAAGSAELITTGRDGWPQATLLPIILTDDVVLAHMARANSHWRDITDGSQALLVCAGAQADVSPAWHTALTDQHEAGSVAPPVAHAMRALHGA